MRASPLPRKHVCETDMSGEAIERRLRRLAGLYDLAVALKRAKPMRLREPSARHAARAKGTT